MDLRLVKEMAEETSFPHAYDHFAEGESPAPPFLVYYLPNSENFAADGEVYFKSDILSFELYTDKKSPADEAKVEAMLDAHHLFYNKSEVWIADEKLYEVLYETCV